MQSNPADQRPPTDYVLFIHGVDTRYLVKHREDYAKPLIALLDRQLKRYRQQTARRIIWLPVYWGDVNEAAEKQLCQDYQQSHIWHNLWFKDLRVGRMTRFGGDIALYLSRSVGGQVADRVAARVSEIATPSPEDRLHLVTHSLGTVILFDILFSARWEQVGIPGRESVMAVREKIYGIAGDSGNPQKGVQLGSITTMGSPIGIFSLINASGKIERNNLGEVITTHTITPGLKELLAQLHQILGEHKLPWLNFVHPGDPIASPLEKLVPRLVDKENKYIDIADILVPANLGEILKEGFPLFLRDLLTVPIRQTALALLIGSSAHSDYWHNSTVAEGVAKAIQAASVRISQSVSSLARERKA
jgi:hypothetical protein